MTKIRLKKTSKRIHTRSLQKPFTDLMFLGSSADLVNLLNVAPHVGIAEILSLSIFIFAFALSFPGAHFVVFHGDWAGRSLGRYLAASMERAMSCISEAATKTVRLRAQRVAATTAAVVVRRIRTLSLLSRPAVFLPASHPPTLAHLRALSLTVELVKNPGN